MNDQKEDELPPSAEVLASRSDLAAADLATVFAGLDHADDLTLERALGQAAKDAEARGDGPAQCGYRLLSILCTFHMRVEDQAQVWGPRWQGPDGRSYTASDLRGEQTAILANFAATIAHPALRGQGCRRGLV